MYAFIREVSNEELDGEVDMTKLITYMIDSYDEKVNFTCTRCLYSSMPLHHKDYWYRISISSVNECHNGCFRKVCHMKCILVKAHTFFISKECQSILRHTINGFFSQLDSIVANGFLSASQR